MFNIFRSTKHSVGFKLNPRNWTIWHYSNECGLIAVQVLGLIIEITISE